MNRKKKNVQWIYISSRQSTFSEELSKCPEKMLKKERKLYAKYWDINERPHTRITDERKCQAMFNRKYKSTKNLNDHKFLLRSELSTVEKLAEFFKLPFTATMLVFSGISRENGDWVFVEDENEEEINYETVNFEDVKKTWENFKNKSQKHLLIINDSNYSGHWCRKLMLAGEPSISIQASCRYWQHSTEDYKLGAYFLHNLFKTVRQRKGERIIESLLNQQYPRFFGSYPYVLRYFDLKLKFDSWMDMRRALGTTKYGSWPRCGEGDGVYIGEDGCRYEGDMVNGKKEGFGALFSPEGILLYEGQWKEGKLHGKGVLYYKNGMKAYDGNFENGEKNGFGTEFDQDGNKVCEGEYKDNMKHGKITEFYPNGKKKFEGEYRKNKRKGFGTEYFDNGKKRAEGNWDGDKLYGDCKIYWPNGNLRFEGQFKDGLLNGHGKEYWPNGVLKYEGNWKNGKYHGEGKVYSKEGIILCEGTFYEGLLQGQGIVYYINGNILYQGEFEQGKAVGIGFLNKEEGSIDHIGKNESVFREAMVENTYADRRQTRKFEDKGFFDRPLYVTKSQMDCGEHRDRLYKAPGKKKIDLSKQYRVRKVAELTSYFPVSTNKSIKNKKIYGNLPKRRKSVMDSFILEKTSKSKSNGRRTKSFFIPKTKKKGKERSNERNKSVMLGNKNYNTQPIGDKKKGNIANAMRTKFYYETITPGHLKESVDFRKVKEKAKREIRRESIRKSIDIKNMPISKYSTLKSEFGKKKVEYKPKNLKNRRKSSILRELKDSNKVKKPTVSEIRNNKNPVGSYNSKISHKKESENNSKEIEDKKKESKEFLKKNEGINEIIQNIKSNIVSKSISDKEKFLKKESEMDQLSESDKMDNKKLIQMNIKKELLMKFQNTKKKENDNNTNQYFSVRQNEVDKDKKLNQRMFSFKELDKKKKVNNEVNNGLIIDEEEEKEELDLGAERPLKTLN